MANLNGVQFIRADAAVEEFLAACFASNDHLSPLFTIGTGNGQSSLPTRRTPIPALWIHGHVLFLVGLSNKIRGVLPACANSPLNTMVVAIRPKNVSEFGHIELLGRVD